MTTTTTAPALKLSRVIKANPETVRELLRARLSE